MARSCLFAGFLFAAFFLVACGGNSTNTSNTTNQNGSVRTPAPVSPAATQDELAKGRDLYVQNCAKCHKESGEGGPVEVDGKKLRPDNLTDDRRKKLTDEKMLSTLVEGIEDEGMPSFKDKMSEAEMREVVKYIRVALQKQSPSANSTNLSAQ